MANSSRIVLMLAVIAVCILLSTLKKEDRHAELVQWTKSKPVWLIDLPDDFTESMVIRKCALKGKFTDECGDPDEPKLAR
jgi:hypothetical protein